MPSVEPRADRPSRLLRRSLLAIVLVVPAVVGVLTASVTASAVALGVLFGPYLAWLLLRLHQLNTGLAREVRLRSASERRLHASEEQLRAILASTLDPVVTIDAHGTILSASDSVERVFGWQVDELRGQNVNVLMPEPHRSKHDGYLAKYRDTNRGQILGRTREFRAQRRDGSTFPCELCVNAVSCDLAEGPLFAGIIRDISERREREDRSRRLVRGLEAAGAAFILTDADGVVAYTNRAFERLTGHSERDIIGRPFDLLETHFSDLLDASGRWRADGPALTREITDTRRDGTPFEAALTIAPEFDQLGGFDGFVAVLSDIAALKSAQDQLETTARELEARNAEMEQFVYTVSHDLKSPLVTIRGFAGHLAQDVDRDDRERIVEDIEAIRRATSRMTELIDDLLELSRIGRVTGEPAWVDLRELIDQSLSGYADQRADGTLRVEITELPRLFVDATRMQQVFDNLVGNAVKYGAGDGGVDLRIGAEAGDGIVSILVTDDGPGIDPAYHEKIFNLFARLSTSKEGTGIGLAICKRVVEHLQGCIRVESAPGRGATFRIELPAALATVPEGAAAA